MITEDTLRQIMPHLGDEKRSAFLPPLQSAMNEFEVNTPQREAAFLAQIAHESGEFRWMEEIWGPTKAQQRYEPDTSLSSKLGNAQPGDGKRFKGRGPIQVTGRANYERYGSLLGLDLVNAPEQAATPEVGFRIAGLYWKKNGLNELADAEMFETITRRINGGLNGLEDRMKYYTRAKEVLGVPASRGILEPESERGVSLPPEFSRGREAVDAEPQGEEQREPRPRKAKTTAAKSAKKKKAGKKKVSSKKAGKKKVSSKKAGKKKVVRKKIVKKTSSRKKQVKRKSRTAKRRK